MIKFDHVHFSYSEQKLFKDLCLEFEEGKITCIFGFSGSGKSSLLKLILKFFTPQQGDIQVFNQSILHLKNISSFRRNFGVIFQYGALFDSLSVFDNIAFPLKEVSKMNHKELLPIVEELTIEVGLSLDDLKKSIHALSGGMRRRVAIARALALRPKILLADEATTGLDPISTRQIFQLIAERTKKYKLTTLVISHDIREALHIAEDVLFLEKGEIVEFTSKEKFIQTKNTTLRQFMQ